MSIFCETIITSLTSLPPQFISDLPSSDLPICKELDKQRSTLYAPLVVHFPIDPQYEAFCMLISFVLSSDNRYPSPWELHHTDGPVTCLYRNCVKFTIPECAGSVTLIDSSAYFEVHISAPGPKLRYFIREAIFTGAAAVLKCEKNPGIICPCKVGDTHVATVGVGQKLWICKKNSEKWGKFQKLQPSQKEWFESEFTVATTPNNIEYLYVFPACTCTAPSVASPILTFCFHVVNRLNCCCTVFLRSDAAVSIYFSTQCTAATILGRRLIEGGIY